MHVLGISAFQRDSAAALVRDGELLAVLAEERFSRSPHEAGFPRRAVRACLARAGIEPQELDVVAFAEKPSRCFERLLQEELSRFPRSWRSFPKLQLSWLGERLWARGRLATEIGVASNRVLFVESQRARAAWARLASPAERAAILVSDEAREWATTTLALADGGALEVLGEVHAPHGLARFAAEAAHALGLAGIEDLPRLAALAERGEPSRRAELAAVLAIGADGSHTLDLAALPRALGPVRADAAASVIALLGDALLAAARELERRTRCEDLCFGGELAALPVLHTRLLAESPFRRVLVPPAPGEVGAAAGAALLAAATLGAPRVRALEHVFLGEDLLLAEAEVHATASPSLEPVLRALGEGLRVGWVRGRAEVGRRSLGHRSLLFDPAQVRADERSFEQVCAVPAERAQELFELPEGGRLAARLAPLYLRPGAAAVQLVDAAVDPAFHELLTRYGERSGRPLLACLPLSRPDEPSVRRELDARELLEQGVVDLLCIEGRVLERTGRPNSGILVERTGSLRT